MLENFKKDVCEIAKQAQRTGLCKHKSGNFSARDNETGYIVITPTSVDRELLTPRDMVVMDKDAYVLENLSSLKPTGESLMHLKIYEIRPDAMAIAHTHSVYATTFALLNKSIPAIVYEVANLGITKCRIPVAPYGRPGYGFGKFDCGSGKATSELLVYQIKKHLGDLFNIVDATSRHELRNYDFSKVDYILTMVDIDVSVPVPIIMTDDFYDCVLQEKKSEGPLLAI